MATSCERVPVGRWKKQEVAGGESGVVGVVSDGVNGGGMWSFKVSTRSFSSGVT